MGKSSSFPESLGGNMKPEYLYSIATDLGLQFDGEARVMYGEREGFLLVIEGAQTKNVFTISLSVKQGSEGDLIEDSEILWNELKEQSKAINAISSDGYLTSIVVKGGMQREGCRNLMDSYPRYC